MRRARWATVCVVDFYGDRCEAHVRSDVCAGWSWTLYRGGYSVRFGETETLAGAKRAVMREAKRRGWKVAR